jgi:hypothetical protein
MNARIRRNWTGPIEPISWQFVLSGSWPGDQQKNPSSIERSGDFPQDLNGARRPINAVDPIWAISFLFNFAKLQSPERLDTNNIHAELFILTRDLSQFEFSVDMSKTQSKAVLAKDRGRSTPGCRQFQIRFLRWIIS